MQSNIDLRSDTVTLPTRTMREAISVAEVGDDHSREDPSVNQLEITASEFTGKEAALFVPSGTMANLVALLTHCGRGDEVVAGSESHITNHEGMGAFVLGGLSVRTVANDFKGRINLEELKNALRPEWPKTAVLCLENTHNRCGGSAIPKSEIKALATVAREHAVAVHVDGARIVNAAVALELSVADLVEDADSVSFCFSKGLGAPVGSVLCGSRDFIAEARFNRRLVGGAMRQSGIIAEAARYALEHHVQRISEDHANAQWLYNELGQLDGITMDPAGCDTNLVFFELDPDIDGQKFRSALAESGVRCSGTSEQRVRMACHLGVDRDQVKEAARRTAKVLTESIRRN